MTLLATHAQTHACCWHVWRKVTLRAAQSDTSPASDCLCASSKCLMLSLKAYNLALLQATARPLTSGVRLQLSSPAATDENWAWVCSRLEWLVFTWFTGVFWLHHVASLYTHQPVICLRSLDRLRLTRLNSTSLCGIDSALTFNLHAAGSNLFKWIQYLTAEGSKWDCNHIGVYLGTLFCSTEVPVSFALEANHSHHHFGHISSRPFPHLAILSYRGIFY